MPREWTGEEVLALARQYQPACILAAAAELDLFSVLAHKPLDAEKVAPRLSADRRAMRGSTASPARQRPRGPVRRPRAAGGELNRG